METKCLSHYISLLRPRLHGPSRSTPRPRRPPTPSPSNVMPETVGARTSHCGLRNAVQCGPVRTTFPTCDPLSWDVWSPSVPKVALSFLLVELALRLCGIRTTREVGVLRVCLGKRPSCRAGGSRPPLGWGGGRTNDTHTTVHEHASTRSHTQPSLELAQKVCVLPTHLKVQFFLTNLLTNLQNIPRREQWKEVST